MSDHSADDIVFADRTEAGRKLAARLVALLGDTPAERMVVCGLPRGGVVVAHEVARALNAPLDVLLVRKLGVPWHPELAFGAIAEGGLRVLDPEVIRLTGLDASTIDAVERAEWAELERRARVFRGDRPPLDLTGHTAIIVDDGLATGSTARVACEAARARHARSVIVAVPVAPVDAPERLADAADRFICLATPVNFFGVGRWYRDFRAPEDDDVRALLDSAPAG
ncbi:phosphoribosyltransferase [Acidothermus cellulolyticus]|nr:phosphoribosyltransferase family protein [Acidothermus cellulolyticus]